MGNPNKTPLVGFGLQGFGCGVLVKFYHGYYKHTGSLHKILSESIETLVA